MCLCFKCFLGIECTNANVSRMYIQAAELPAGTGFNAHFLHNMRFFLQILVVGDSIVRGLDWDGFDVRTFPGYTAERIRNQVIYI